MATTTRDDKPQTPVTPPVATPSFAETAMRLGGKS